MPTRRAASPARRSKKTKPGWALVLLGLALGLAVAGLTYLYVKDTASKGGRGKDGQRPADAGKPAKPRFDFYTILPEIESVVPESRKGRAPPKPQEGERYVLQAASLAHYTDADELKAKLALAGLEAHIEKVTIEDKGDFYRVRLGPYTKWEELEAAERRLTQLGIKPLLVKLKPATSAR